MPPSDKPIQPSPFEIVTSGKSKKIGKTGIVVGVSIVVFLILSVVAGVLLVRQQQRVQEKAATCSEACPVSGQPNLLMSCHPASSDGSANESLCNLAGRIETCGPASTKYCCPSAGGTWTTNLTACATPTPTIAATATPATTLTPTPTSSGNSCNKVCGSNSNCQSGLYCYSGYCRNPLCASDSTCGCGSATPTATATSSAQTTPLPIPVTGTDWATYAGLGVGAMAILVSILLAL